MSRIHSLYTSFNNGEITPRALGRSKLQKYTSSLVTCTNFLPTVYGGIYNRQGTAYVASVSDAANPVILIPFEASASESYIIEAYDQTFKVYKNNAVVASSITHPYADTELADLRWAQSNDILYLCHPDYAPRQLVRTSDSSWAVSTVSFTDGPYLDPQTFTGSNYLLTEDLTITMTPSATTGSVTFTASGNVFQSTDVGRIIRYRGTTDDTGEVSYTGTGTQTYFDIPFYPKDEASIEVYLVSSAGQRALKTGGGTDYTITSEQVVMNTAPTSSEILIIRRQDSGSGEWGYATITAYSSATSVTATVNRTLDSTNASTDWQLGAWSATTGYPKVITFHEQRLIFANTYAQPLAVWGSKSFDFTDFSPDNILNLGDQDDDTSFTFVVASNILDQILWINSQKSLLLGTLNNIYAVSGGSNSASITPTAINISKEVNVGSKDAMIAQTDTKTIFIDKLGRSIRSLGYRFEIDGFTTEDLNLFSEHIGTESAFTKIVYTSVPNKTFWILRANGTLVSLTYLPDQDVAGWAKHTIGGTDVSIVDIASITSGTEDRLYLIVERTINSSTVRYIEYLTDDFNQTDKEDAKYSDSLKTYSGSSTSTITGLSHLEGETVVVLADGNVHPDCTVSSGQITLEYAVTKAQVGLSYTSTLETVPVEAGIPYGTTQMTIQRVIEAGINFLESLNCKFGYNTSSLDRLTFRTSSDNMDSSPGLFTGYKTVSFPRGQELDSRIVVQQDQPLPVHIRSIVLKVEVSDK